MSDNNNLDFIQELGIGVEPTENTDSQQSNPNESNIDLVQDSNTEESKKETSQNTEPDISVELRKQIEGLEKRINDKDDYINTLREQSKAKEEAGSSTVDEDTSTDFWDDPEKIVKDMQETMRIQQMQIQETHFANTVDDYWKTVNPEALQKAVATDTEFAKEFNSSNEPYRVAYEYLNKETKKLEEQNKSLRDQIREELLKEMGVKEKKEAVPNMGNMGGSSNSSKSEAPDDGFSSVFGSSY